MKRIKNCLLSIGILSFVLAVLMYYPGKNTNAIFLLTLPFEIIGKLLRWLSLSSAVGNMIAFLLYVAFCLLPFVYFIIRIRKSGRKKEDLLLPAISVYCFYMAYEFINPSLMLKRIPEMMADQDFLPVIKISFAIIFYALCISYLIFRLLSSLNKETEVNKLSYLCKSLQRILYLISAFYTFLLGYITAFQMFSDLDRFSFRDGISMNCVMVFLTYLFEGLPIIFSIFILVSGIELLNAILNKHLQSEEFLAAVQLSQISKRTVYVTVISNLALNIIQFLFTKMLNHTSYQLKISIIPIIIAFSAMILSGYFKESKELYEDNEMII
jgi:hypothetical protein